MKSSKAKKILIAEDEKPYSRALTLKLQNAGFDITVAHDGEEALRALTTEKFDLLLCDIVMPKMNGFQVVTEIRKKKITTPFMGLTNLSQVDDEKKMREAGAIDFISKSNTPINEVIRIVKTFFEQ